MSRDIINRVVHQVRQTFLGPIFSASGAFKEESSAQLMVLLVTSGRLALSGSAAMARRQIVAGFEIKLTQWVFSLSDGREEEDS